MNEKRESLEEMFKDTLNDINTNLCKFFKYYRKEFKHDPKLSEIFYTMEFWEAHGFFKFLKNFIKV